MRRVDRRLGLDAARLRVGELDFRLQHVEPRDAAGLEPRLRERQLRFGKRDLLVGDAHALLVHQRRVEGFDDRYCSS